MNDDEKRIKELQAELTDLGYMYPIDVDIWALERLKSSAKAYGDKGAIVEDLLEIVAKILDL